MTHFQRMLLVLPALVAIDANGDVGHHLANNLNSLLVVVQSHLDLDELVGACLLDLLSYDLLGVNADCKTGHRSLTRVKSPDFVPGLSHDLAQQVVQRDIHTGLGSTVVRSLLVHIGEDVLNAEWVGELSQVQAVKEGGDALDALAQIGRH